MIRLGTPALAAVTAGVLALAAADFVSGNSKGEMQMETGSVVTELLGNSVDVVRQKLGDPIREDRFELGMEVSEFRIELTNLFDDARRKENPPDIREATWSLSPDENLTLWFSQTEAEEDWRAIHFISWHPDDQF